jgi:hypothetical protein
MVENADDNLSTHVWRHGNYGLQRARTFPSKAQALTVIRSGFRAAGGHLACHRRGEDAQDGQKACWLCPGRSPHDSLLRWRASFGASYDTQRFSAQRLALQAAQGVHLPEGAGRIKIMSAFETILVS